MVFRFFGVDKYHNKLWDFYNNQAVFLKLKEGEKTKIKFEIGREVKEKNAEKEKSSHKKDKGKPGARILTFS